MSLKSDVSTASSKATAIKAATEKLASTRSVTFDSQTTVAGNTKAKSAIEKSQNLAKKIASAVNEASSNLQSVAHDFEAMDNDLASSLFK